MRTEKSPLKLSWYEQHVTGSDGRIRLAWCGGSPTAQKMKIALSARMASLCLLALAVGCQQEQSLNGTRALIDAGGWADFDTTANQNQNQNQNQNRNEDQAPTPNGADGGSPGALVCCPCSGGSMPSECLENPEALPDIAMQESVVEIAARSDTDARFLRLMGAPADHDYSASYPNTENLRKLIVSVRANGMLETRCLAKDETVSSSCEVPFYSHAERIASGTRVVVSDIYNHVIAKVDFPSLFKDNGCTCMNMNSDAGDVDGSVGGVDRSEESTTVFGHAKCQGVMLGVIDAYCKLMNEHFVDTGVAFTLDCQKLAEKDMEFHPVQAEGSIGRACHAMIYPVSKPMFKKFKISPSKDIDCYSDVMMMFNRLEENTKKALYEGGQCNVDPLVLDLDGNGIYVSTPEQGVAFDLLGTGSKVQTAWIGRGDALLALDRNGNGSIDGAAEIFGDTAGGCLFDDGFAALSELDRNHDGRIDRSDAVFMKLRLWRDANRDGHSAPGELQSLRAAKIQALELNPVHLEGDATLAPNGAKIPAVSRFVRTDGSRGLLGDVSFRFRAAP